MNELLNEADRLDALGNPLGRVLRYRRQCLWFDDKFCHTDPNAHDWDGHGDGFYNGGGDGRGDGFGTDWVDKNGNGIGYNQMYTRGVNIT